MRTNRMKTIKSSGWFAGVSRVLIFTMVLSTFMHEGWYSPKPASAVTYGGEGWFAVGTSPLTPSYPGSIVANDLLVLIVGMKPATAGSANSSVTTPAGWTALTPVYGATGTLGADTGPTNLFAFYRNATGSETGTLSVTTTGANSAWSQIYKFTSNTAWSVAQATGADTATGAEVSIAFGADPVVQQGDYILAAMCIPTDVGAGNQFSAQAFSQAGVTFGTVTEISEPYSATGNDVGGFVIYAPVASGTATGNPTMTATADGTTTNIYGPGVFIRIRETNPPIPGTIALSVDTGVYTSASPTITATFGEDASNISGCEYTTNGSTWIAGTLSGSRPTYTCTAKPAGLSGSLTINMRATSGNGTGTATALTRTADGAGPTDGTLTVTPGTDQNSLSWTAATDGVSGLRTTNPYDVRMVAGATLPASCSAGTSIYTGTATSYAHTNLTPVAGGYSYRVCAYDKVDNASAGATRTGLPTWSSTTTSCGRCHGYTSIFTDATTSISRGTPDGAFVGDHDAHVVGIGTACVTCHTVPGGTDYAHRDGDIQMQAAIAGGSYSKVSPIAQVNNLGAPTTGTCSNISCHGANNPTPQWGVGTAGCVDCHKNVSITRTMAAGTLDPVVGEFGQQWGHKKSGRGAVTNADCIVCHLEGNYSTQKTSGYHADGNIDLRDPDGAGEVAITNNSGAAFTFTKFALDLTTARGSVITNSIADVITHKFCLKCHDANGAANTTARVGANTAFMPWGGSTGYATADGAAQANGLINVAAQFATTNSSAHPVLGPRSADYPTAARLATPYKPAGTRGTSGTVSNSVLLNCFDCHSAPTPSTTRSVPAHGSNATNYLRGVPAVSGTPASGTNESTLCKACHLNYNTVPDATTGHGAGSAVNADLRRTEKVPFLQYGCNKCHASNYDTAVVRPVRAMDVHGVNALPAGGLAKTGRWLAGGANGGPIAFIRNTVTFSNHNPRTVNGTTFTVGCTGMAGTNCGNPRTEAYTPGGTY